MQPLPIVCPTCGAAFEAQCKEAESNVRCPACGLSVAVQGSVASHDNPLGVWRDGRLLVVRLSHSEPPPRCVKTNESKQVRGTRIDAVYIPYYGVYLLLLVALGHVFLKVFVGHFYAVRYPYALYYGVYVVLWALLGHYVASVWGGATIPVRLPVSSPWLDAWEKWSKLGWLIMKVGIICSVLSFAAYFFCLLSEVDETKVWWLVACFFAGPVIGVAGGLFLMFTHRPIVRVRKLTDNHVWLAGVHYPYLVRLPQWPTESTTEKPK